jgi:hypothetical protein
VSGASAASLIVFPGRPVIGGDAEVQMILRRIHSPTQQREEERHQDGKSGETRQELPETARE